MDTFRLLYFGPAESFTKKAADTFSAPMSLKRLVEALEERYPGIGEKVLKGSMVTVNLEYVEMGDEGVVLKKGDEVAVIPPAVAVE
ncbi:molybdopterin synthase small subunit CnxG [Sphaerosporella brunnea]|uniref:Molybdopterin synthase small subunit CnxG n=1 Tax=Sphaerosporella brunnea TaxID=1250544 RepID=A0A5J5F8V9_9PEZI|nr:molybdopterin synthase small subunit CnxG [Sphaerosporella brunnea]